jgi:hypothetical protein
MFINIRVFYMCKRERYGTQEREREREREIDSDITMHIHTKQMDTRHTTYELTVHIYR